MYHWKQTDWNEYRLIGPDGAPQNFKSYRALHLYCLRNGIDAVQV